MNYREVVDDILSGLKQLIDDSDITRAQVVYWMHMSGNRFKQQHLNKTKDNQYLNYFSNIDVVGNGFDKHLLIPAPIYDLANEGAIGFISYNATYTQGTRDVKTAIQFTPTRVESMRRLYYRDEERPTPSNPYYYLLDNHVRFLGVENIMMTGVQAGIFTGFNPITSVNLDDEFRFPLHLIPLLKQEIINMGRLVMLTPDNLTNDGEAVTDIPSQKQTGPIIQPNVE